MWGLRGWETTGTHSKSAYAVEAASGVQMRGYAPPVCTSATVISSSNARVRLGRPSFDIAMCGVETGGALRADPMDIAMHTLHQIIDFVVRFFTKKMNTLGLR